MGDLIKSIPILNAIFTAHTCAGALDECGIISRLFSNGIGSWDPNDKIGYRSPSGSTYFDGEVTTMTYIINFENDPKEATVAAQDVHIVDRLDLTKFDINSFRAEYVNVADKIEVAPYELQEHTWDIDMIKETGLIVRVSLTLDKKEGIAKWHFQSIDPATNKPTENVLAGFLPPNDETGRGHGSVAFSINLKPELPDDVEISNYAEIVFDNNDAIVTDPWVNRRDVVPPVSRMSQPAEVSGATALMKWSGTDAGSGIWYYYIYVSENQGNTYTLWQSQTAATQAIFTGELGHEYRFFSIATDSVGNVEAMKTTAEITIKLIVPTSVADFAFPDLQIYPNPFTGEVRITGAVVETLRATSLQIINAARTVVHTQMISNPDETLRLGYLPAGVYFFRLEQDGKAQTVKVVKE